MLASMYVVIWQQHHTFVDALGAEPAIIIVAKNFQWIGKEMHMIVLLVLLLLFFSEEGNQVKPECAFCA